MNDTHVDILAIAAHPDDIEMSAAGVLIQASQRGRRTAIVDCTRGELGTRGSAEERDLETEEANKILQLSFRENLNMPDGNIIHNKENILLLVRMLRKYTPKILLIPPSFERHPDHESVHRLCRAAYFNSGLTKIATQDGAMEQKPHRPRHIFCYMQAYHHEADFYVDVSDAHEAKINSVLAYVSQVHVPGRESGSQPHTFISRPEFMEMLEARARYFGSLIGVRYAEGFMKVEPLGFESMEMWL